MRSMFLYVLYFKLELNENRNCVKENKVVSVNVDRSNEILI